jgi:hypothetical protein
MGFSKLNRQETADSSKQSDTSSLSAYEKGLVAQKEYAPQHEVIKEEDEDEVGQAEYLKSLAGPAITPAQNKAILRRIDCLLLPLFLLTQTLQYLDKTALVSVPLSPLILAQGTSLT